MVSWQSDRWMLSRMLNRAPTQVHRKGRYCGGLALLMLLALEVPGLAQGTDQDAAREGEVHRNDLTLLTKAKGSEKVEPSLSVAASLLAPSQSEAFLSESSLIELDAIADREVPTSSLGMVLGHAIAGDDASVVTPEVESPADTAVPDLAAPEKPDPEAATEAIPTEATAELESGEPVSADDEPVVEASEPEDLIEDALGGEEAAADQEIVVVPLADRCAALESEADPAVVDQANGEGMAAESANSSDVEAEDAGAIASDDDNAETIAPKPAAPNDINVETTAEIENVEVADSGVAGSEDTSEADVADATESTEGDDAEISGENENVQATADSDDVEADAEEIDPELAAKQLQEKREICQLYQADQLYESGQIEAATALYQTVKPPFDESEFEIAESLVAVTDPEALSPGGQVYLREAQAGQEQQLETRTLVPLKLLTETHPEYTPGHVQYADALVAAGQSEKGLEVLNNATALHPNDPEIVKANIALAAEQGEWMDASMQARRFAQLNPDHPEAEAFATLAQENLKLYQGDVRDRLTANTIANVLTGAITYGVTGNIWNTLSTIQTTTLMLRGEEGVGNSISKSIQRQIPLVDDEEVVAYVNDMGQRLAKVAGRDEFDYEFFVIMDENLNAFALPGGKIFVNAGAIAKTRSETELAGLLSHEIAHAVLSHGFQLVSNGSLLSDLSRFVPYAGYAANLVVLDYSRNMEREADELGTRILAAAGYPADGLHNLMQTLGEETQSRRPLFAWMSTHPETEERVGNIRAQIQAEGFERYNLERVERHDHIRERVKVLIDIAKREAEEERKNRPWWR